MNYNTHVSWVVFFASLIVLGLILGGVFGIGRLIFDKYMRDRSRRQEQEARGD